MHIRDEKNLLDGHPDGLSKHFGIYKEVMITPEEVYIQIVELGNIPFYVVNDGIKYLGIIGSDLILEEFETMPDIFAINEIYSKTRWYTEFVYKYLNFINPEVWMFGTHYIKPL